MYVYIHIPIYFNNKKGYAALEKVCSSLRCISSSSRRKTIYVAVFYFMTTLLLTYCFIAHNI